MRRWFTSTTSPRLWRVVHIVTAVLVFYYIAFDILDLDLSDFPLKQAGRERVAVVTEVPKETEPVNLIDHNGFRVEPTLLDFSVLRESIRLEQNILRSLRFHKDRPYVHRLIFPRSASSESPPAA